MKAHLLRLGECDAHQLAIALLKKATKCLAATMRSLSAARTNLEKAGILPPREGWFREKLNGRMDAVILGMHAKADNPELIRAKELNLPIYSFPEYIFEKARLKKDCCWGSHGKTTTTSMIMHVLKNLGRNLITWLGTKLEGFDQSVNISNAPLIICEGDEYPASVLENGQNFISSIRI